MEYTISMEEMARLDALYEGRKAFHGELHDHSDSGGTSDGKQPLSFWKERLAVLKMDFAAILDHRQVRHMYLPEWDDTLFVCGTEPGTVITDSGARVPQLHYNMIFPTPTGLEEVLAAFPEYRFEGGKEGHFVYPGFTRARFCELIESVKAHGGFFVLPHPKQIMESDEPLDYYFTDGIAMEVFYVDMTGPHTPPNYELWTALLSMGKRVWCSAGGDLHNIATDRALTTIFAKEHRGASYLPHLREGDFVCGSVGIRMCVGDTRMGGSTVFGGRKLIAGVGDFHASAVKDGHTYRMDVMNENGVFASVSVSPDADNRFAFTLPRSRFVRTEIFDETDGARICISNPIWNDGEE